MCNRQHDRSPGAAKRLGADAYNTAVVETGDPGGDVGPGGEEVTHLGVDSLGQSHRGRATDPFGAVILGTTVNVVASVLNR